MRLLDPPRVPNQKRRSLRLDPGQRDVSQPEIAGVCRWSDQVSLVRRVDQGLREISGRSPEGWDGRHRTGDNGGGASGVGGIRAGNGAVDDARIASPGGNGAAG